MYLCRGRDFDLCRVLGFSSCSFFFCGLRSGGLGLGLYLNLDKDKDKDIDIDIDID